MYLERLPGSDRIGPLAGMVERSPPTTRNLLLSSPLTLPLPGLPRSEGQSEEFTRSIRERLEEFRARRPLFQSLVVPVTLTFLVVPPEQGKDLDNIALTALPIAHDVLRPHIEPHLLAPTSRDEPEPWREDALARLRSVNAQSVSAYQVIELPRSPEDPPEGTLRLALGRHTHESWWDQATRYLDAAIERAHERDELTDSRWERVFTTW
jgi:hypothetical protein